MFLSSPSTNWMFTISHWNIWTGLRTINYLVIINIYFLILQVRSFNFLVSDSTKYKHLANQYYKACIRREAGYCKIAWSASSDPDSFKIRKVSKCQTFSSFIRKMWKISTNFIAYFCQSFLFYEIDIDTLLFPVVQMGTTTATPEQLDVSQTLSWFLEAATLVTKMGPASHLAILPKLL